MNICNVKDFDKQSKGGLSFKIDKHYLFNPFDNNIPINLKNLTDI